MRYAQAFREVSSRRQGARMGREHGPAPWRTVSSKQGYQVARGYFKLYNPGRLTVPLQCAEVLSGQQSTAPYILPCRAVLPSRPFLQANGLFYQFSGGYHNESSQVGQQENQASQDVFVEVMGHCLPLFFPDC
jgi:hypothetical protein